MSLLGFVWEVQDISVLYTAFNGEVSGFFVIFDCRQRNSVAGTCVQCRCCSAFSYLSFGNQDSIKIDRL